MTSSLPKKKAHRNKTLSKKQRNIYCRRMNTFFGFLLMLGFFEGRTRRAMFVPDYMFDTVYDIPLSLLEKEHIRCLLLDIDNTLVPYDVPEPTADNRRWFETLAAQGSTPLFVSNNHPPRVERYAKGLGIAYTADAGKPGIKKYRELLASQGIPPEDCAAVGDQIFTDVLAASRLGVKSILVKPIKDVENRFFRFKRFWERPFVAAYRRRAHKHAD